jgi:hypothetical protein
MQCVYIHSQHQEPNGPTSDSSNENVSRYDFRSRSEQTWNLEGIPGKFCASSFFVIQYVAHVRQILAGLIILLQHGNREIEIPHPHPLL